jgi:hypothetical protein
MAEPNAASAVSSEEGNTGKIRFLMDHGSRHNLGDTAMIEGAVFQL